MTVFKINGTKIKLNISIVFICVLWIIAKKTDVFIVMTAVVLLHEIFHAFVAYLFGFHTESIEIFPFGGEAVIRGIEGNFVQEAMVVASGPLLSLFTGFLWAIIHPEGEFFTNFSYSVAMLNLLPVYPLDGGRLLMCVLKGAVGEKKGRKYTVTIGIAVSVGYFCKSLYDTVFFGDSSFMVMASFMLVASLKAIKNPRSVSFREHYWKNENVKIIKAYEDERIIDILNSLGGNCFYCILVSDKNENAKKIITEKQIFDGALENSTYTLKELSMRLPYL